MQREYRFPGWLAIILWFVFFWPVGIYKLNERIKIDKPGAKHNCRIMFIFGVILMVFNIWLLGSAHINFGDIKTFYPVLIIMLFPNFYIFLRAVLLKKEADYYEKQRIASINESKKFLNKMTDDFMKDFKDFQNQTTILFTQNQTTYMNKQENNCEMPNRSYEKDTQRNPKVVICQSCGGKNTVITGTVSECEYCGSPLS
ncbi:hypothetical protein BXY41_11854 [Lacrimispora xylanisolvens]|uniref:Uncharacterized protein n=1 Tax=Lacrimispora xylanisolvens TaxID=384636 RepID=A0A2S6HFV2_9FIRM|nr:hypothetical protein [Hungatella xylanolytica]PPK76364.1 hypothetical protein BXY41_11854 [Hungatella xylanolytica]